MKKPILTLTSAAILLALGACSQTNTSVQSNPMNTSASSDVASNILLQEYKGPYGGVPAFDKMRKEDVKPAMKAAIDAHLAELNAIANVDAAPTFENTIVAMEKSGQLLDSVYTYYGIFASNKSSPEFREIQREISPMLSEYYSKMSQNEKLFARVKAVYESEEMQSLSPEEQRVTLLTYNQFARNGATLEGDAQARYAEINKQLAKLHTQFANNVLHDEEFYVLYLDESQLSGLPESFKSAAAAAAKSRGKEGKYAITNTRSSMDPFLTYSDERGLREQVWKTYYNRGNNGDEYDNNALIKEILTLRHERVNLLGYDNYAKWRLEDRMAKNPKNAMDLMQKVWPAAISRVEQEVADMQAIAKKEGHDITIKPWDYRYYAEKVRKAKYDLDSDEIKQYLQLDKLQDAMFYVADRVFNYEFTPVPKGSVPVFHEDVVVYEVKDKESKALIGLWYLDPFARQGKRSGAWATTYRGYQTFGEKKPVLSSNNSNFVKGPDNGATLISWDDAETFFHEFGHALHFLSTDVQYPSSQSGVRDYTEFQSQLLERWLLTDEVINNYLVHHETGKPIPASLVEKIKRASTFNEGFKTTEYLASALMDLYYHTTDPANIDPQAFEKQTLNSLGMPEEIVMRHRSTHFGHIFSGEGYSSGYYGYMWAEVLTSDAAEAFEESPGGYYDQDMSEKLVKHLFSIRNAMDPADAYRLFRGRDAKVEALMRDRGFPVSSSDK